MFGKNPKRGLESGDGSRLQVVEIFPTLQGEGPFVGMPSVFLRLGGCNLACEFCDTEFETFKAMSLNQILESIDHHARALSPRACHGVPLTGAQEQRDPGASAGVTTPRTCQLVVITGGEPFRQNIVPLCEALLAAGFEVQIETNGTLWRPVPEAVNIVCSPKVTDGHYHPIRPDLLARVNALKFIISAEEGAYHTVADVGQSAFNTPVYVQPMDAYDPAKNAANLSYTTQLALKEGYRLSLQMHKILGIS